MASERRVQRLQQMILQTVAQVLQREIRDPRVGLVSVTRVKLASDLSVATVGWSMLGSEAEVRTTERGLEDAIPLVQRAVAEALQIRSVPRIRFKHDDSLERAQALEGIFEQLRQERRDRGEDVEASDADAPPAADDA